jgi:hypothetical protein
LKFLTLGPTFSIIPAPSSPIPDGSGTGYSPDLWYVSIKFKPIAECLIKTSFSLGSEMDSFSYFKTSGPPVFEKFIEYI